ncbi:MULTISPECIES: transposase family protein [unclassified Microcoleus]|uniref:transposase family protein n=1 Tax=unclassified Microcoleus TaxID=2642155 RepID=UPI002FD4F03E
MARGFSKAVTSQQKQTDSLPPSMNLLSNIFLEHFRNYKDPRIERSKEHLLKDIRSIAILAVQTRCRRMGGNRSLGNAKYEWLKSFL